MQSPTPRLETRNLVRRFDGRAVVNNLTLRIFPGQVTCLLGPSGCGKSTTLRMIAGVEQQDEGEIWVDGRLMSDRVTRVPPEQRGIGLMFQDFALFPHLSVFGNVAFGLRGSKAQKRERVLELLNQVDLLRYVDCYPHQLSGGEQQRVALARAMGPRPRIMLMDEPFSGLDNRLRDGVRDETLRLLKAENTAVLLVTHEPEEAMRMADEIALMRDGHIAQTGAPYNVYSRPVDHDAVAFFSDTNSLRAEVHGAIAQTPFGQFLAPGFTDGTEVEIIFRPQHVKIDFDRSDGGPLPTPKDGTPARGIVERARFMGSESLIEFRMDFNDSLLRVLVPGVFIPNKGKVMWLTIRRDKCFVFPLARD
ncbi:MAG: ABC transporter ATP-binding protein [Aestuariivita sp.]|nr:ABC transporter ATP-binding protein [Aestuariivita sp.]MCY4203057.1 ABC transporter ATP-binding protein [Aestuariivita sp.]MCY4289347.1 ABC transporter ATP-binding protein [Aestuariivita sp.]MCY4347770.1 ABC transporter ATP-binding protein [Aestuariivita sp.]